ncbi:MAG: hypothetical protein IJF28_01790 [Firmicutes bacterium]|nr:hypothetical protein [Bacillota bacterium]
MKKVITLILLIVIMAMAFLFVTGSDDSILETISVEGSRVELFLDEGNNLCLRIKDSTENEILLPSEIAFDSEGNQRFALIENDNNPSGKYMTLNHDVFGMNCFKIIVGVNSNDGKDIVKSFYYIINESSELDGLAQYDGRGFVLDLDGDSVNEIVAFEYGEAVPDLRIKTYRDGEISEVSAKEFFISTIDQSEYTSIDNIYMKIYDGTNLELRPAQAGFGQGVFPEQGEYAKILVEYTTELGLSGKVSFSYSDIMSKIK